MLENKKSVTNTQLVLLIEELERDPTLSDERLTNGSKTIQDVKWNQLAKMLNAVPNGAKRSVPRWKTVLSNWKLNLKQQTNSNESEGNTQVVDELGKRLLKLVEEEELVQDVDIDLLPDLTDEMMEIENHDVFRRPLLGAPGRRLRSARAGLGPRHVKNQKKGLTTLHTIYGNNLDRDGSPERKILQMQLDRLHSVSQQLESHIQDVQYRIQMIKDMWQHECMEE